VFGVYGHDVSLARFASTVHLLTDRSSVVAIYQAPQSAYDLFDKVSVLYEGEQIFFGKTTEAKKFFVNMGFYCPDQQTVPDFLTSLTSASERRAREGFEHKVPVTPAEFAAMWKASPEYAELQKEITAFGERYPVGGERRQQFLESRRAQQSKHTQVILLLVRQETRLISLQPSTVPLHTLILFSDDALSQARLLASQGRPHSHIHAAIRKCCHVLDHFFRLLQSS
jgi:ABC-type multidrug transport system ATPase subunit